MKFKVDTYFSRYAPDKNVGRKDGRKEGRTNGRTDTISISTAAFSAGIIKEHNERKSIMHRSCLLLTTPPRYDYYTCLNGIYARMQDKLHPCYSNFRLSKSHQEAGMI
jgi:hypothetical protein